MRTSFVDLFETQRWKYLVLGMSLVSLHLTLTRSRMNNGVEKATLTRVPEYPFVILARE